MKDRLYSSKEYSSELMFDFLRLSESEKKDILKDEKLASRIGLKLLELIIQDGHISIWTDVEVMKMLAKHITENTLKELNNSALTAYWLAFKYVKKQTGHFRTVNEALNTEDPCWGINKDVSEIYKKFMDYKIPVNPTGDFSHVIMAFEKAHILSQRNSTSISSNSQSATRVRDGLSEREIKIRDELVDSCNNDMPHTSKLLLWQEKNVAILLSAAAAVNLDKRIILLHKLIEYSCFKYSASVSGLAQLDINTRNILFATPHFLYMYAKALAEKPFRVDEFTPLFFSFGAAKVSFNLLILDLKKLGSDELVTWCQLFFYENTTCFGPAGNHHIDAVSHALRYNNLNAVASSLKRYYAANQKSINLKSTFCEILSSILSIEQLIELDPALAARSLLKLPIVQLDIICSNEDYARKLAPKLSKSEVHKINNRTLTLYWHLYDYLSTGTFGLVDKHHTAKVEALLNQPGNNLKDIETELQKYCDDKNNKVDKKGTLSKVLAIFRKPIVKGDVVILQSAQVNHDDDNDDIENFFRL